ncbi:MAG: CRISPR-associated DxTHG motif protein, partial [Bradymonadaceae bacterium]
THGFRSQPALGLLILNYLQSLNEQTRVEDILYGAFDPARRPQGDDDSVATFPLVSLIDVWELNQWAAGFRTFGQTGDVEALCRLSSELQDRHMRSPASVGSDRNLHIKSFATALQCWHQDAELCAIPQMYAPRGSLTQLLGLLAGTWSPVAEELGRLVLPLRERMARDLAPMAAESWNDLNGLRGQLQLMRWLVRHKRYQQTVTLAREWLVTAIAIATDRTAPEDRESCERIFGKLSSSATTLDDEHARILGPIFLRAADEVSQLRNGINHAWIGRDADYNAPKAVHGNIEGILDNLTDIWGILAGTTLFTPLGRSPGVVFTAIAHHKPRRVAILTSREGLQCLDELRARLKDELNQTPEFHHVLVDDPFADFEAARTAAGQLERHRGGLNIVNIAGGTTALQFGIQALADHLDAPTGAGVDRRTPDEQRSEPYHLGEWVWLKGPNR